METRQKEKEIPETAVSNKVLSRESSNDRKENWDGQQMSIELPLRKATSSSALASVSS